MEVNYLLFIYSSLFFFLHAQIHNFIFKCNTIIPKKFSSSKPRLLIYLFIFNVIFNSNHVTANKE